MGASSFSLTRLADVAAQTRADLLKRAAAHSTVVAAPATPARSSSARVMATDVAEAARALGFAATKASAMAELPADLVLKAVLAPTQDAVFASAVHSLTMLSLTGAERRGFLEAVGFAASLRGYAQELAVIATVEQASVACGADLLADRRQGAPPPRAQDRPPQWSSTIDALATQARFFALHAAFPQVMDHPQPKPGQAAFVGPGETDGGVFMQLDDHAAAARGHAFGAWIAQLRTSAQQSSDCVLAMFPASGPLDLTAACVRSSAHLITLGPKTHAVQTAEIGTTALAVILDARGHDAPWRALFHATATDAFPAELVELYAWAEQHRAPLVLVIDEASVLAGRS